MTALRNHWVRCNRQNPQNRAREETPPTMHTWILLLSLLAALAAACAQATEEGSSADTEIVTPAPTTSLLPTTEATLPGAPDPPPVEEELQSQVELARADLARRLGVEEDEIQVVKATAITWRDGSLGCPQPGFSYIQVLIEGAVIELKVGSSVYSYHSGGNREPFLCEQ